MLGPWWRFGRRIQVFDNSQIFQCFHVVSNIRRLVGPLPLQMLTQLPMVSVTVLELCY